MGQTKQGLEGQQTAPWKHPTQRGLGPGRQGLDIDEGLEVCDQEARRHERSRGQGEEYVRDRLAHPPLSGSLNKTMTSPRAHAGTTETQNMTDVHAGIRWRL